jgi:hypothetical protein
MNRQQVKGTLLALVLIASALSLASVAVSRKSPEFTIYESSGKATPLSSLKGKVVVMEFLFIRSEHCLRVAQTLNKLHSELGPRGFQPVGVVFDPPNAANASVQSWALMVDYFKLTSRMAGRLSSGASDHVHCLRARSISFLECCNQTESSSLDETSWLSR